MEMKFVLSVIIIIMYEYERQGPWKDFAGRRGFIWQVRVGVGAHHSVTKTANNPEPKCWAKFYSVPC